MKLAKMLEELENKARFSGWDRQDSAKIILWLIKLLRVPALMITDVDHPLKD